MVVVVATSSCVGGLLRLGRACGEDHAGGQDGNQQPFAHIDSVSWRIRQPARPIGRLSPRRLLTIAAVSPYRPLRRALYVLVIFAGAYVAVGEFVGFGDPAENESAIGEISRWCERVSDGLLREPVNALGNLGFVITGLAMFWVIGRDQTTNRHVDNEFIGNQRMALVYASASLFLGPGSFLMHGTNTLYGALIDNVSMVAYILVPVLYNLRVLGRWESRRMFSIYASLIVLYAVGYWFLGPDMGVGFRLFEVAIPLWLISEALIRFDHSWFRWASGLLGFAVAAVFGVLPSEMLDAPDQYWWVVLFWLPALIKRGPVSVIRWYFPWFLIGVASFGGAYAIWLTGTDANAQCDPDTLLQPHAIWHVLSAVATFSFFLYFRTEEDRSSHIPSESWSGAAL